MQVQQLGVSVGRHHFSPPLLKNAISSCSFFHNGASIAFQLQATHPRSCLHSLSRVSATLQENVAESIEGTTLVKVKFVLKRRCEFGQQFYVVGDDESFGAWNPESSIPMQWSEGHVWTTEMEVSVGKRVEFKVILMGGEGVVDWQPGPNRVLETLEAPASPVVLETEWGEDDSSWNSGIQLNEAADMEFDLASSGQISSNSIMKLRGVDIAAVGHCKERVVDEVLVETITEVSEQLAAGLASKDANKDTERKLSVLEKDLQWVREALSMIWGTFIRKGNKNEV